MSLSSGFFNAVNHDRLYNADEMSRLFDGLIRDGVFASIGTCFVVTQNTGMTVSVGVGRAWFDHTWTLNDAILPVEIGQSEMLVPRIDAVVIEVNHEEAVRQNSIKVIKGTPGTNPAKPTLTKTDLVKQYPLCYITVGAAVKEIRQADIENAVGTTECPFVTGILEVISIEQLIPQWKDILNKFVEDNTKSFNEWMTTEKTSYEAWLQANKDSQAQFEKDRDAEYAEWFDGVKDSYSSWFATIKEAYDVNWKTFQKWESDSKDEFDKWFETIKDQLDGDTAGKLVLRDEQLQKDKVGLIKMGYDADSGSYYAKDTIEGKLMIANAPLQDESYDIVCCGPKLLTEDIYNLPHAEYKGAACDKLPSKEVRNLIPFPYAGKTLVTNGITFTINDDGTIIANGTATASAYFNLTNSIVGSWNTLPAGTYKILGGGNGVSWSNSDYGVSLQLDDVGGVQYINSEFTISEEHLYKIFVFIKSGITVNNVIFKPMLTEDTTITTDDYVKYSEDPVVLPNRVKITFGSEADSGAYFDLSKKINLRKGSYYTVKYHRYASRNLGPKNLLKQSHKASWTSNGITFTLGEDGSITVNGTLETVSSMQDRYFYLGANPNKDHTYLTGCPVGGADGGWELAFAYKKHNKNGIKIMATTCVTNGDNTPEEYTYNSSYTGVYLGLKSGVTYENLIIKPMVTWDQAKAYDDYEPYVADQEIKLGVEGASFYGGFTSKHYGEGNDSISFNYDGTGKLSFVCYSKGSANSGESITISDFVIEKRAPTGLSKDYPKYDDAISFTIYPSTEFPLITDKAFDGETTIFAPEGCEIYYPDGQNGVTLLDSIYRAANSGGIYYIEVNLDNDENPVPPKNAKLGDILIMKETYQGETVLVLATKTGSGDDDWDIPMMQDMAGSDVVMSATKPARYNLQSKLWIDTANDNALKYVDTDGTVTELASGGVSVGATAPTNTKLLWIDTGNGGVAKYWNGSAWTPTKAVWG